MQNSEEVELKKINQKYALDREEQRLNLIQELAAFHGKFSHWGTREYAEHGNRIRAAQEAMVFIETVLFNDEQRMIGQLYAMASLPDTLISHFAMNT